MLRNFCRGFATAKKEKIAMIGSGNFCLLYTSPSPRD